MILNGCLGFRSVGVLLGSFRNYRQRRRSDMSEFKIDPHTVLTGHVDVRKHIRRPR